MTHGPCTDREKDVSRAFGWESEVILWCSWVLALCPVTLLETCTIPGYTGTPPVQELGAHLQQRPWHVLPVAVCGDFPAWLMPSVPCGCLLQQFLWVKDASATHSSFVQKKHLFFPAKIKLLPRDKVLRPSLASSLMVFYSHFIASS